MRMLLIVAMLNLRKNPCIQGILRFLKDLDDKEYNGCSFI